MNSAKNGSPPAKLTPNKALKDRNTFGLDSRAEFAYEITTAEQIPPLLQALKEQAISWRVLGGGSNVILPTHLLGATLLMNITGQAIENVDEKSTFVSVGAGENWHTFVTWTLDQGLPGLENLALIPGTVGAAPIQNIGAYGVEIGEYIDSIEAFDSKAHAFVTLTRDECQFAYRDSLFKQHPNRFIVTRVIFQIPKSWSARISYADLTKQFSDATAAPTPKAIFAAVCQIRNQKLPDPKVIGNAGSFFQNPLIDIAHYESLIKQFPEIISYPATPGKRKLGAGWLIDHCGFKGLTLGPVGVYKHQALVIVHYGNGTAQDIMNIAKTIQEKVHDTFGVHLTIEPNIL